jgi:hypothetical protein
MEQKQTSAQKNRESHNSAESEILLPVMALSCIGRGQVASLEKFIKRVDFAIDFDREFIVVWINKHLNLSDSPLHAAPIIVHVVALFVEHHRVIDWHSNIFIAGKHHKLGSAIHNLTLKLWRGVNSTVSGGRRNRELQATAFIALGRVNEVFVNLMNGIA